MRIRLSLTLSFDREPKPGPEPDTREYTGALVEMSPQPRMVGFTPAEVD